MLVHEFHQIVIDENEDPRYVHQAMAEARKKVLQSELSHLDSSSVGSLYGSRTMLI